MIYIGNIYQANPGQNS